MTTKKKELTQAVLAGTKTIGGHTVYPATYGLIFWLADVRKSPAMHGGKFTLNDIAELCWSFTLPSEQVERIPAKARAAQVKAFMHSMTPEAFTEFQKHAETEILRYFKTTVTPKKPQARPARPKQKVKR
jgi:hypothetical protein